MQADRERAPSEYDSTKGVSEFTNLQVSNPTNRLSCSDPLNDYVLSPNPSDLTWNYGNKLRQSFKNGLTRVLEVRLFQLFL